MIRSNLLFVLVVLAFNLLFAWQQQGGGAEQAYFSFEGYAENSVVVFWLLLAVVSFLFCLFSFPGAGFSLSLGGYIWGLEYLFVAGAILFLSTWASFPFARRAKDKSRFFRKIVDSQVMGEAVQSIWVLTLLRMNPAVPFLFFASFYKEKIGFRDALPLLAASVFHAFIYVLVGWNMKIVSLSFKELSLFVTVFMLLTLVPVILIAVFKTQR